MKLTAHQKDIVDKIISGEIFDIPSYLRVFGKGHEQQYDLGSIQATFDECENGMTYIYKEYSHNFYTEIYDSEGNKYKTLPVSNQMTYQLRDTPMKTPVKAQLDGMIKPEQVHFRGKTYSFNFLKGKYLVADSFMDIKDFVALWSYLRREALVFKGEKPVTEEDLSIFFELVDQEVQPDISPKWKQKTTIDESNKEDIPPKTMIPEKSTDHYLNKAWKLNCDSLAMCEDFVDIRLMATSELLIYRQKGYRTVEELSQRKNLAAAWAAVIISLISVLIGNILPLFQKTDTDYLSYISQQISSIEERIDSDTSNEDILDELNAIHEEINSLTEKLEQEPPADLTATVTDIAAKIEELSRVLEEGLTGGQ